MSFQSIGFMIFFLIVVLAYYLMPKRWSNLWLLGASYYFYMCWNTRYILLLVYVTGISYVAARGMKSIKNHNLSDKYKKAVLAIGITLTLAVLLVYKYLNFFLDSLNDIGQRINIDICIKSMDLLLPVGISFFTFQAISYLVDVYRNDVEVEENVICYALYVSFFPTISAGPIQKSKDFLKCFHEKNAFSYEGVRQGLLLIVWGFFQKLVIADRIGIYVDEIYNNYTAYTGVYYLVAMLLFTIQVYCDFSGYTTIALGTSRVLGFTLEDNFSAPLLSQSVTEFWRRWHISLSSWFREYLYIPLGGNRKGTVRKYINILIVFCVSGLWHGANWTFLVWGFLNGFFQVLGGITHKAKDVVYRMLKIDRRKAGYRIVAIVITCILIDITFIFFRASDVHEALHICRGILHTSNWYVLWDEALYNMVFHKKEFDILLISLLVLLFADICKYRKISVSDCIFRQDTWCRWTLYIIALMVVIIFGVYGVSSSSFIYFAF